MNLLTAKEISKTYRDRVLLDGADFGIEDKDKTGIVGINGTGKSTLLKILAGLEEPDTGEVVLGDIILNTQRAKQQAESLGHSEKREFAFLIVHSMLHLFGYDHMTEEDAAEMEERQRMILEEMHILR